jgi:hypothetical protein
MSFFCPKGILKMIFIFKIGPPLAGKSMTKKSYFSFSPAYSSGAGGRMRYPLEWWGEGRDARLLAAMDISNNRIYTVRIMLTTGGDRVCLSVMTLRDWKGWSKYRVKTETEPEWYSTTQHSKPYAEWLETGVRTYR